MSHKRRNHQSYNIHRQEVTARCAFTGEYDLVSQMVRTDKLGSDGPFYFSSVNALAMYKHQIGICPLITGDAEQAHTLYMETLKKCYPKLYRRQFGNDEKPSKHNGFDDDFDDFDDFSNEFNDWSKYSGSDLVNND